MKRWAPGQPLRKVKGKGDETGKWTVNCPECQYEMEYMGYFDQEDVYICENCGEVFECEKIVFGDGSFLV
jgi:transposase